MIFGPIARFRRLESRFSGQNWSMSSEMRVYKKSSKFQNFILVPGVQKTDFPDFSGIFTIKLAGNPGISSETTRESRVRRPGNKPGGYWMASQAPDPAPREEQERRAVSFEGSQKTFM